MTRKSLIARENKRMKTVAKYATKRALLVAYLATVFILLFSLAISDFLVIIPTS